MHIVPEADSGTAVLLVHAPYPGDMKFRGVPSSMLAAAGPFIRSGEEIPKVGYLDPVSADKAFYERLTALLEAGRVRAVCISTSTAAIEETARIAATTKAISPEVLVIAGGPHEDDCDDKMAARIEHIDISIAGEAEFALEFLLRDFLARDERPGVFASLALRRLLDAHIPAGRFRATTRSGRQVSTARFDHGPIAGEHLETHVLTDRLPRFDIFDAPETLPIMVSRGCPYGKCTFCAESIRGGGVLVSERFDWITELRAAHPDSAIYFQDSIFPRGRVVRERLLPMLRDMGVEWGAQVYLRALTRQTVDELASHGCTYLYTGLETASADLLTAAGKVGMNAELALERLGWMRDAGVRVGISLMFGVMDVSGELLETIESVDQTMELADAIRASGVPVTRFYPNVQTVLPGTALARGIAAAGISLDFYRMPVAPVFDVLEDGGVGYNFATLDASPSADSLAECIRQATVELRSPDSTFCRVVPDELDFDWEVAPSAQLNLLNSTLG